MVWRARLSALGLLCGCAAAALTGCSTVSSLNPFSAAKAEPKESPALACPTAAILKPLSQTASFTPGAAQQPTGVAFYGLLSEVDAKCDRVGNAARASLDVIVVSERGPAAGAATGVDLQYFVAVTTADNTIVSKRSLTLHIPVPVGTRRAGVTDHLIETIPLIGANPADTNIVLGFQQTPDVVEFYRHYPQR
jgi:hypothetical protein